MPTNPQLDLACGFLSSTGENVFLTGRAGTGKTTFLHRLREWRNGLAREQGVPAYVIATQKALIGITNAQPSTVAQLGAVKGIGRVFIEKYGARALKLVEEYRIGKIG